MSLARDIQVAELSFVVTGNPARKRRGLRSRLVGQRKRPTARIVHVQAVQFAICSSQLSALTLHARRYPFHVSVCRTCLRSPARRYSST